MFRQDDDADQEDGEDGQEEQQEKNSKGDRCAKEARKLEKMESLPEVASTDSVLAQMCGLASNIYAPILGKGPSGWILKKHWDLKEDECKEGDKECTCHSSHIGVYQAAGKGGKLHCTMSFAGTDDSGDWLTNLRATTAEFCGFQGVHKGFAKRMRSLWTGSRATELFSFLADPEECADVTFVGHSLGGALASLAAACAACQGAFAIRGLFTFGAPAVSKTQLKVAQSGQCRVDGLDSKAAKVSLSSLTRRKASRKAATSPSGGNDCFQGYRVYNAHPKAPDPIPSILQPLGFKHPRVAAIVIDGDNRSIAWEVTRHECQSQAASSMPLGKLHSMLSSRKFKKSDNYEVTEGKRAKAPGLMSVVTHGRKEYLNRILGAQAAFPQWFQYTPPPRRNSSAPS